VAGGPRTAAPCAAAGGAGLWRAGCRRVRTGGADGWGCRTLAIGGEPVRRAAAGRHDCRAVRPVRPPRWRSCCMLASLCMQAVRRLRSLGALCRHRRAGCRRCLVLSCGQPRARLLCSRCILTVAAACTRWDLRECAGKRVLLRCMLGAPWAAAPRGPHAQTVGCCGDRRTQQTSSRPGRPAAWPAPPGRQAARPAALERAARAQV